MLPVHIFLSAACLSRILIDCGAKALMDCPCHQPMAICLARLWMAAGQGIQAWSQNQETRIQTEHEGHDSDGVGQKSLNK